MTPAIIAPAPHDTRVPDIKPKEWKQPEPTESTWRYGPEQRWIFGGGR